jgi:hypothetical protein
MDAMPLTSNL